MKNKKKFDQENFFISIIFIVTIIVLLIISLYKIIKAKSFDMASTETTILFFVSLLYVIYRIIKDKNILAVFVKEKDIIKTNKRQRIIRYIKESLIFSIIIVCLDLLSFWFIKDKTAILIFKGLNTTLNLIANSIFTFGLSMLISFGLEYLLGEMYIKK